MARDELVRRIHPPNAVSSLLPYSRRRPLIVLGLVFCGLAPSKAQAQPGAEGRAPSAPTAGRAQCSDDERSALSEISCEIGRQLRDTIGNAVVVAAPPVATGARILRDGRGLGARLANLIAGQLGTNARPATQITSLPVARSLASRSGQLVYVTARLENGALEISADVYTVARSLWDRIRNPNPAATAHAFASRRIDAEIATFLEPVPLSADNIDKSANDGEVPAALACGDLDGDGSLELLMVGRTSVATARLRGHHVAVQKRRLWRTLAPVAPSPLRQPIASASVMGANRLSAGITDRTATLFLDGTLAPVNRLAGIIFWPGMGCLKRQGTSLGALDRCERTRQSSEIATPEQAVDAIASVRVVDRRGASHRVVAWRREADAAVVVSDDRGGRVRIADGGAQLALGDVDLDGQIEIVSSVNTLEPSRDALVVHTWLADGSLKERYRLAIPSGVRALAVCPPEQGARSAVAVATSNEVWVIR